MTISELEEGQIVLCTVERIVGTTVFVKIEGYSEGTITTSEIAPGRIRNLREYVVPGKKIVCKILSIKGNKIYLSLRRVKQNERKELLDKLSKEKSYKAILKTILQDKAGSVIENIELEIPIVELFEGLKENPAALDNFVSKQDADKIKKILETKSDKPKKAMHIIKLSSDAPDGINVVKNILTDSLSDSENCEIEYIAAGKYRISINGRDFKKIEIDMNRITDFIEKSAKRRNTEFVVIS